MSTLLDGYDAVLLDLDGTLVRGKEAVPGASEVLDTLHNSGVAVQFITNNASRSPEQVADHLAAVGIRVRPDEVATSAQAAVAVLAGELPAGSPVFVLGAPALADGVREAGLRVVTAASDGPVAVVQGHSPDTCWAQLAEACLAIRAGARWIACNVDRTLPTERGLLPGNGSMVAALEAATDRTPTVTGKPERPLLDAAVRRVEASKPLVVGDRLDTDIAGARAAEMDSLLVLSGVSDAAALLAAPPQQRPVFLGADVRTLCGSLEAARIEARPGWRAVVDDGTVVLQGDGAGEDPLDALRTVCALWWMEGGGPVRLRAADEPSARTLDAVGLGAAVG